MTKTKAEVTVYSMEFGNTIFEGTAGEYSVWKETEAALTDRGNRRAARWEPTESEALNRDELVEMLRKGMTNVTFIKKDGSIRHMRATLCPQDIPLEHTPKSEAHQRPTPNQNLVSAYDIDAEGWRTITVDKVLSLYGPQ